MGLVAHTCPIGEYNEMATLLFSSQEGIVELLFSRHEPTVALTLNLIRPLPLPLP